MQDFGMFITTWPDILGTDSAGEVVEVGSDVKNIHVGQRVLVHAQRLGNGETSQAAFQKFILAEAQASTPLPKSVSYEDASALPLSVSTAAHGLYSEQHLGLPLPTNSPQSSGKSILVWGGSSSVGAAAVQLAVASGLKVLSTASSKNFAFVKSLGADQVFDYNKANVVDDVVAALKNEALVGAYDGKVQLASEQSVADGSH
jgi:NADPH:quinone reductase-like Zn-dependent oxidoreductase